MSISSVGASDLSQNLMRMLSRLDSTNDTTSPTTATSTAAGSGSGSATPECAASNALTGTGQSALSDQIMSLLVTLQQQSSAGTQAGTSTTAASATQVPAIGDPIQQLFSAMDANGDGSVSQTEMESYIEGKGGTQAQADTMFSALTQSASGQTSSTGISEQQFSTDVSQAQHSGRHHHHHGGGSEMAASGTNTSDLASQIFGALDTNQDGNVSASEFATAFAANPSSSGQGANAVDPSALFAQIDSNNNGSVTSGDLGTFLASITNQAQSDFTTLGAFGQLAMQSYGTMSNLLNNVGAGVLSIV